jgi:uncharacterized protein
LAKHHLDFAEFEDGFDFRTVVVLEARRSESGRIRWKLIGEMRGVKIVAAIVSPLGSEALSLVSLRQANPMERKLYEKERQT